VIEATGWTVDQVLQLTVAELQMMSGIDPVRRIMRVRV
jgi:hypothetical protein